MRMELSGTPRDEDKAGLEQLESKEWPDIAIGSPPCTCFHSLLRLIRSTLQFSAKQHGEQQHLETAPACNRRPLDMEKTCRSCACWQSMGHEVNEHLLQPGHVRRRPTWMASSLAAAPILDCPTLTKCTPQTRRSDWQAPHDACSSVSSATGRGNLERIA